jgi:hypothetical protein
MKKIAVFLMLLALCFPVFGDRQPDQGLSDQAMNNYSFVYAAGAWQTTLLASDGSDITDPASGSLNVQVVNPEYFRYTDVTTLEGTPQNLTASWADIGAEVSCQGFNKIGLWVTLDINNSLDARIRALAKHTSAGTDEYTFPILTPTASQVNIEAEFIEFTQNADQKMLIKVECDNVVPYVQFQIQAGTVGATPGTIAASITKGY